MHAATERVMCHVLAVRVAEEAGTTLGQTDR